MIFHLNYLGSINYHYVLVLLHQSARDAVGFDEKYVKAVFAALLYPTPIYTVISEYETDRRYVDLLLTRRPPIDPNISSPLS